MTSFNRLAPVFALLLIAIGCDTVVQEEAKPPTLIPAQAFTVETELFEQELPGKTDIGTHAMIGRMRVWPVTTTLAGYLTLPAVVTRAALEEEPAIEAGAWVWEATVPTEHREVAFALSGTMHGGYVDWTMRVTSPTAAGAEDSTFVLYTARTAPDGSSGSWALSTPDGDTTRSVIDAAFEIGKENEKTITFQVSKTAIEHAGDAIVYTQDGDQRSVRWSQVAKGREHMITWDAESHAGSITATNYNDDEKACWDDALQNEACTDG